MNPVGKMFILAMVSLSCQWHKSIPCHAWLCCVFANGGKTITDGGGTTTHSKPMYVGGLDPTTGKLVLLELAVLINKNEMKVKWPHLPHSNSQVIALIGVLWKKKKKFTSSGSVLLCLHPLALMPGELYGESVFSLRPI